MSKKQTAVEWLESQFANIDENRRMVFDKAKQMEKEQILEAVSFGDCRGRITTYLTDEQYYNETYGK